jgi:hypothetical protein
MWSARPRPGLVAFTVLVSSFLFHPAAFAQVRPPRLDEAAPGAPASAALLIVEPPVRGDRGDVAPSTDAERLYERRILTHAAGLKSEHTIRRVLSNPNAQTRKTQWFRDAADPLERSAWLRDHLRVTAIPGTSLIQVELPDLRDAGERKQILFELCQTYLDGNKRVQVDALLDRTTILNNVRIKTEARLRDIGQEMRQKQIQLNVDGGGIGRIGVKEMELSRLVGERVDAELRTARARATLEAVSAAAQQGETPPALEAAVEAAVMADPRVAELTRRAEDARLRADLARAKPAGADKAVADEADAEARVLAAHAEGRRAAVAARAKAGGIEQARATLAQETAVLERLTKRVEQLKDDLGELSNATVQYYSLQEEQKGLREQLKTLREQLDHVMALSSSAALADVRWYQMPEAGLPTADR